MVHRDLYTPIDDEFVDSLTGITGRQVLRALSSSQTPMHRARILNRINNMQHLEKGKEITAYMLFSCGFQPQAEVAVPSLDLRGRIQNVLVSGDTIVLTIRAGQHIDTTHLVPRDAAVIVWPLEVKEAPTPAKKSIKTYGWMKARDVCENLETFLGRTVTLQNRVGYLRSVTVTAGESKVYHFTVSDTNLRVHEHDRVYVYLPAGEPSSPTPEPDFKKDYIEVPAGRIKAHPTDFLGRRVIFDGGVVDGVLSAVGSGPSNPNSVVLTVDGESHQATLTEMVRVYPKPAPLPTTGYVSVRFMKQHKEHFVGRTISVKFKGTGILTGIRPSAMNPGCYWLDVQGSVSWLLKETDLVFLATEARLTPTGNLSTAYGPPGAVRFDHLHYWVPNNRPDFQGSAWSLYHNVNYRGNILEIGPRVKGIVSDVLPDNEGKIVFVIDGVMHKRNRQHEVRMWKKEN